MYTSISLLVLNKIIIFLNFHHVQVWTTIAWAP